MKKRVLIVDDHDGERETVARFLKRRSIHVETASSFTSGLECARSAEEMKAVFDLVVLDLGLPDTTGPEDTLRRSKEFGDVKIMPWTGYEDHNLIGEFQRLNLPFVLKGGSATRVVKQILIELEWQQPSEPIERAILDAHLDEKKEMLQVKSYERNWLKRNAAPLSAACAVLALVLTVAVQAFGGVDRVWRKAKDGVLTEATITTSLKANSDAIKAERDDRTAALADERSVREKDRKELDAKNAEILGAIADVRRDLVIIHGENETSKAERRDLRVDVTEVKGTTHDIYNYLLDHPRGR